MVDAYASLVHYQRHLEPIWGAVAPGVRGTLWKPARWAQWPGEVLRERELASLVMVASAVDAKRMRSRRVIYVEHGAGQSYLPGVRGQSSSYAGGPGYEHCGLFICPNEVVAARWKARYEAEVAVVGSPVLDRWVAETSGEAGTVAVTWHWDCRLVPETRSALPHYLSSLPALARLVGSHGRRIIGHAHPKARRLQEAYERAGIEWVRSIDEVYARAGLLIVDNSSVGYEFAALGRPTIWCNAPWYRRDVEHGLRFWSQVPGPQVDDAGGLLALLHQRLSGENPGWWEEWRLRGRRIGWDVLGPVDGQASIRAARAVEAYAERHG